MVIEGGLDYGTISRQIDYRDGRVAQVVVSETKNLMPENGKNIEIAVGELNSALLEAMAYGYKSVKIEVDFRPNKNIKIIKISKIKVENQS